MTSTQIDRVAGGALIAGTAIALFWGVAHVIPAVLLGAGIWVVHRRQASAARRLGLGGALIVSVALALGAALRLALPVQPEWLARYLLAAQLLTFALLCAGMVAFGIAANREHVFPRLAGNLMAVGAPLYLLLGVWGQVAALLGFALFGYYLVSGRYGRGGEPGEIAPS